MFNRCRSILWKCCTILLCIAMLTSCSFFSGEKKENKEDSSVETQTLKGIVTQNDTQESVLEMRDLESDTITRVYYSPVSEFYNKFGTQTEGEQIGVGEIMEVTYRASDNLVMTSKIPEDVWEHQEVRKFTLSSDEKMMTVAGKKYRFSSKTYCAGSNGKMSLLELNKQDRLVVRGIGYKVYSVVREQGHGYIRFTNYEDFIGGMAEISESLILPITENMLVTATEGTYRITLYKNGMSVSKTVTLAEDEEQEVDFGDGHTTMKNIGVVRFQIEPSGAELFINGTSVDYEQAVSLRYGKYKVQVILAGYESYSGILKVAQESKTVHIELVEETEAEPSASPSADDEEEDEDAITKKLDSDHTITVSAPEGVEVYLDSVYKGLSPCTFTKIIGSQTITLSKSGYVTKSYSVDILDDDKNTKLSFADLEKDDTAD